MTPEEFNYIQEPTKAEAPEGFTTIPIIRPKPGKFEAHHNNEILFTARVWFLNAEITTTETYSYSKSINPFDFSHSFQAPNHQVTIKPSGIPMSEQFDFQLLDQLFQILPHNGGAKLTNPEDNSTLATYTPEWRDTQIKKQLHGTIHTLPSVPALALAILFLSPQIHDGNNHTPEQSPRLLRPN